MKVGVPGVCLTCNRSRVPRGEGPPADRQAFVAPALKADLPPEPYHVENLKALLANTNRYARKR